MNKSESIKELAGALCKAQAEMAGAKKDATNPHFKSKYADLASVWEAARHSLTKNGLSVCQYTLPTDRNEVRVETILMHSSGEWVSGEISIPVDKANAHGVMSALTYGRRGLLAAMTGVAPEDDDGNTAADSPPKRTRTESEPPSGSARGVAVEAFQAMSASDQEVLRSKAQYVMDVHDKDGIVHAVNALHELNLDNDSKLAIWSIFDSEFRSSIKREEARRTTKLKEAA